MVNQNQIQNTEKPFYKTLEYKHISQPTDDIVEYIEDRKYGRIHSLKTRWTKLNNRINGGIEANSIYVISGISGSGKSSFANSLETDLIDLNPNENIVILNFSFEMLSPRQVGRKLSYKLKQTTQELYSGIYGQRLSDEDLLRVKEETEKIKQYPIYYVDTPGTVEEIKNTIIAFQKEHKNKWLVIILDHTLLTKAVQGFNDRQTLVHLQNMFLEVKKYYKNTIIELTQLNRSIEDDNRVINPSMHYPQRSDLSSSDAIFQSADVVMVLHRPEILGIELYGLRNIPVKNKVFLHLLKNREGEPAILQFHNNLKYNSIEDDRPNPDDQLQLNI
jgi:replicative DNA helicase